MITDKDRSFARAVVALSREHKVNRIDVSFCSPHDDVYHESDVRFQWSNGRHGAEERIIMQSLQRCDFGEKP